jgi:hypothetical protein
MVHDHSFAALPPQHPPALCARSSVSGSHPSGIFSLMTFVARMTCPLPVISISPSHSCLLVSLFHFTMVVFSGVMCRLSILRHLCQVIESVAVDRRWRGMDEDETEPSDNCADGENVDHTDGTSISTRSKSSGTPAKSVPFLVPPSVGENGPLHPIPFEVGPYVPPPGTHL